MKKQVLVSMLLATSTLALVSGVYADNSDVSKGACGINASGAVNNPERCELDKKREESRKAAETRREETRKLRATNTGTTRDFYQSYSGATKEAVKSLSGAQRDAFKDTKDAQKELKESMSGKTMEQKLASRDALEAAQVAKLQAKYANDPQLLAERMAVYTANKARRDEIAANRMENLVSRSALSVESVKLMDTQVRANMSTMTVEKKAKLVTKIDEKIAKINASKGLTAAAQTEMVTILTTLKADLQK